MMLRSKLTKILALFSLLSLEIVIPAAFNHQLLIKAVFFSHAQANEQNGTLYYGGDILTMAGDEPHYVEAIVAANGSIAFVGS